MVGQGVAQNYGPPLEIAQIRLCLKLVYRPFKDNFKATRLMQQNLFGKKYLIVYSLKQVG